MHGNLAIDVARCRDGENISKVSLSWKSWPELLQCHEILLLVPGLFPPFVLSCSCLWFLKQVHHPYNLYLLLIENILTTFNVIQQHESQGKWLYEFLISVMIKSISSPRYVSKAHYQYHATHFSDVDTITTNYSVSCNMCLFSYDHIGNC